MKWLGGGALAAGLLVFLGVAAGPKSTPPAFAQSCESDEAHCVIITALADGDEEFSFNDGDIQLGAGESEAINVDLDGSLTVTRLILDSAGRTQSMVFETSIVVVVETGEVKLWTRAGTTIDGIPVTSSPATVFVERSQTIIVPGGVRFRVRAWGCGPARLLFITLTG